jgi:hypothetical protein
MARMGPCRYAVLELSVWFCTGAKHNAADAVLTWLGGVVAAMAVCTGAQGYTLNTRGKKQCSR